MDETTRRRLLIGAGTATIGVAAGCLEDDDVDPVDRTGEDTVVVAVGTNGGLAFDPADILIDVGTTVRWEWTGQGGEHDVVADDDSFASERTVEEGHTFEHTFEELGETRYVCVPHQTSGMVGTVTVE